MRILFVDEFLPDPSRDSGSNVVISHAESFSRLGADVFLCVIGGAINSVIDCGPFKQIVAAESPIELQKIALELKTQVIYMHRAFAAAFARDACISNPKMLCLYNISDLHFLRNARARKVSSSFSLDGDFWMESSHEVMLMESADAVILHSSFEARILRSIGIDNFVVAPWSVKSVSRPKRVEDTSGICFVGFFRHLPNIDAVEHFAKDILPLISDSIKMRFTIVGSCAPVGFGTLHPCCHAVGAVSDLSSLLASQRLSIAPLRFGAGVKGKVIDSLALGTPCIMSPIAVEGLQLPRSLTEHLVAEDDHSFAQKLTDLYLNEELNVYIRRESYKFAKRSYNDDMTDLALSKAIATATVVKSRGRQCEEAFSNV